MPVSTLLPANKPERMVALAPYRSLGSHPGAVFDEVVHLTAKLSDVPLALGFLAEENRPQFNAQFGLAGALCYPQACAEQADLVRTTLAQPVKRAQALLY